MALLNWSGVDCMTIPYILFWKLYIPIKGEIPYSSVTFLRSSASKKVIKGIVPKKDLTFLRFLYINVSFFQIFGSFFGSLKADFLQNSGRPCRSWPRHSGSASQWMSSAMGLACRRDHRGLEVYSCYAWCDKRHYRLDILETGRACTQQISLIVIPKQ